MLRCESTIGTGTVASVLLPFYENTLVLAKCEQKVKALFYFLNSSSTAAVPVSVGSFCHQEKPAKHRKRIFGQKKETDVNCKDVAADVDM